jgi:hypothetical protein
MRFVRRRVKSWINDPDFKSILGPEAIAKLPAEERDSWTSLWKDVYALYNQIAPNP